MSAPLRSIASDALLMTEATHRFREQYVRHLLVYDKQGEDRQLRGVISAHRDRSQPEGIEHYLHFRTVGTLAWPQTRGRA